MSATKDKIYTSAAVLASNERSLQRDTAILEENKKVVLKFVKEAEARGISAMRRSIYLMSLKRLGRCTDTPLKSINKEQLIELLSKHNAGKYAAWSKHSDITVLKTFLKWLGIKPEVYAWIRNKTPQVSIQKGDLPTQQEIEKLILASPNRKWASLISALAQSGARPGELLGATVGGLTLNHKYAALQVDGKMGQRTIYIAENGSFGAFQALKDWLEAHPSKQNRAAPVWPKDRKNTEPITISALNTEFHRLQKKANLNSKRLYPYLLRHACATLAYQQYAPHVAQKLLGHGDLATSAFYVHLNDSDVIAALNAEEQEKPEPPKQLCKCGMMNKPGAFRCSRCDEPLGSAGAMRLEDDNSAAKKLGERLLKLCMEKPELVENLISQIGKA